MGFAADRNDDISSSHIVYVLIPPISGQSHIHVAVSPGGTREGHFLPNGIRWVVERLFAWLSRYRPLNIVYDRAPDLLAAHIWIAMISIISRRLVAQTQRSKGFIRVQTLTLAA